MASTQVKNARQSAPEADRAPRQKKSLWRRVLLLAAMVLVTLNIWTGSPVVALWVGSKVQGSYSTLKMSAVGAVVAVLAALVFVLTKALSWLDVRYGEASAGRQRPDRCGPG